MTHKEPTATFTKTYPHKHNLESAKIAAEESFRFFRDKMPANKPTFFWRAPPQSGVADVTFFIPQQNLNRTITGTVKVTASDVTITLVYPTALALYVPLATPVVDKEVRSWFQ